MGIMTKSKKRILIFVSVFIAVVIGIIRFHTVASKEIRVDGPAILFKHKYYNAGEIRGETVTTVSYRFPFRNNGTQKLQITDIKTSCGCTVASKPKDIIEPNDKGFLDVDLTLASIGLRTSDIMVYSNAPSSPDRLTIAATFNPKYASSAAPQELRIDEIAIENPVPEALTIHVFHQKLNSIKIDGINNKFGLVETRVVRTSTTQTRSPLGYYRTTFQLELIPRPKVLGKFEDYLDISFQPSTVPVVKVPVTGQVFSSLILKPNRIVFIATHQDETLASKKLFLYHIKHERLSIVSVNNPFDTWLGVSIKPVADQAKFEITLEPKSNPGPVDGQIQLTVQTDDKIPKIVEIPVVVRRI